MIVSKSDINGDHFFAVTCPENGNILWMMTDALPTVMDASFSLGAFLLALDRGEQMEIHQSEKNGQWWGTLKGEGFSWKSSELYTSKQGLKKGFDAVKRYTRPHA